MKSGFGHITLPSWVTKARAIDFVISSPIWPWPWLCSRGRIWNLTSLQEVSCYSHFLSQGLHPNWCQQIKYIPQLNVVVSCSAVEKSSLVLIILPPKDPERPK